MSEEFSAPDWRRELAANFRAGLRKGLSRLAEVGLAAAIFGLILVVLLLMAKGLWAVYGETPTGQRFALHQAQAAFALDQLLSQPAHLLAAEIVWLGLRALFPLCLLGQLLQLLRRLYFDQGLALRFLLWGAPACWLAAAALADRHGTSLAPCLLLVAFTTLALLPGVACAAQALIPEADDLYRLGQRLRRAATATD